MGSVYWRERVAHVHVHVHTCMPEYNFNAHVHVQYTTCIGVYLLNDSTYDSVARALMANALVSVEMGMLIGSARMYPKRWLIKSARFEKTNSLFFR